MRRLKTIFITTIMVITICIPSNISWAEAKLQMTFIDVGAGDCTYIELPDGQDILIDAGLSGKGQAVVAKLNEIEPGMDLEYVISTHPDADHCGGLQSVFREMKVKNFYYPSDAAYTTVTARSVISMAKTEKNCKVNRVSGSKTLLSKNNGQVQVKFIQGSRDFDTDNEDSIMTYVKYKNFDVLIAGDVEGSSQTAGKTVNTDVLLVPHHGSKATSSKAFIAKYDPEAIVISTDGHKYGHPSQEAINRYFAYDKNIKMYRTDKRGSITVTSNGKTYSFDCKSVPQYTGNNGGTSNGTTATDNANTVYITPTGTKYHLKKDCRGLKSARSIIKTTKNAAINKGLSLCGYED